LSKHVAERLGRPAAKALDVAGHNVERTRREARLDTELAQPTNGVAIGRYVMLISIG
jgi:hypothetical protein